MPAPGKPLVSVVVPVHNVREWVGECLASVLSQTYPSLDVVVVDDGSTDGGDRIVDGIAAGDDRVTVIKTGNQGLAQARNEGLAAARGEWVVFVDSDDWLAPDYVALLLGAALEYGADIAQCGLLEVPGAAMATAGQLRVDAPVDAVRRVLLGSQADVVAWTKIYRIGLFRSGLRFPAERLFEDSFLVPRLFRAANRIVCLPEPLYFYRRRSGSIMERPIDVATVRDCLAMLAEIGDFIGSAFPGLAAELLAFEAQTRMRLLVRMCRQGEVPGWWDAVAGWLVSHARQVVGSPHVPVSLKAREVLLLAGGGLFKVVTRGVRRFLPVWLGGHRQRGSGRVLVG